MRTYGWELRKLVAQRRTLAGLLVAVLIPAAFAIGLAINPATRPAGARPSIPTSSSRWPTTPPGWSCR